MPRTNPLPTHPTPQRVTHDRADLYFELQSETHGALSLWFGVLMQSRERYVPARSGPSARAGMVAPRDPWFKEQALARSRSQIVLLMHSMFSVGMVPS